MVIRLLPIGRHGYNLRTIGETLSEPEEKTMRTATFLFAAGCCFCWSVFAQDGSDSKKSGEPSRTQLKQQVRQLTERVERLEVQLSQMKQMSPVIGLSLLDGVSEPSDPSAETRPLGHGLKVDRNGIIYEGNKPVGVWGVNGGKQLRRD